MTDAGTGPSPALEAVRARYDLAGRPWVYRAISLAGFLGLEADFRTRTAACLDLRPGSSVLDVACGRGGNFPYLQRAVGPEGRIVGVDYSPTMLAGAEERVRARGWTNVELVRGDSASMAYRGAFDGAICTVAMTVIPGWRETLRAMGAAVRPGGRVAVLDGGLATGARWIWTPYIRFFSRVVEADLGRDIPGEFRKVFPDAREERLLGGTYFLLRGTARGPA